MRRPAHLQPFRHRRLPSLFVNDTLGRFIRTGLDVTRNGTLDLASADRALWLTRNLGSRARASAWPSTRS